MDYLGDAAIRREIGKSAINAARTRVGADVMHYLAEQALIPLAQPQSAYAFYCGLRIVSIDGTTLEVADRVSNREAFGVALGGYKDSEVSLAHLALQNLKPDMLCLADRGFSGYPPWQAAS